MRCLVLAVLLAACGPSEPEVTGAPLPEAPGEVAGRDVSEARPEPHPEGVGPGGAVAGEPTPLLPGSDLPAWVGPDCVVYRARAAGQGDMVVRLSPELTAETRARAAPPLAGCPEPLGEPRPLAPEAGTPVGRFGGRSSAGGPVLFAVQPRARGGVLTVYDEASARPVYADTYNDAETEPTVTASDVLAYDRDRPDADFKCPDELDRPAVVQRVEVELPALTVAEGGLRCVG